jgi:hypothetical protein
MNDLKFRAALKFYVALVTAVAVSILAVYGPGTAVGHVVTVIVAVGGAIGVFLAKNQDPDKTS